MVKVFRRAVCLTLVLAAAASGTAALAQSASKHAMPLTLIGVSPSPLVGSQAQTVELSYRVSPGTAPATPEVGVEWQIFEGKTLRATEFHTAPLAAGPALSALVGSVALDLSAHPNATEVRYRAQAFGVSFQSGQLRFQALSSANTGKLPVARTTATLQSLDASEFAGGWGTPPPFPATPPPPTLTFNASFQNTGTAALLASDPTLAIEVRYSDPNAPGTVLVATGPLSATIPAGAAVSQALYVGAIPHVYDQLDATCALVRLDPVTGKVVAYLSAVGTHRLLKPAIAYPV